MNYVNNRFIKYNGNILLVYKNIEFNKKLLRILKFYIKYKINFKYFSK